MSSVYCGIEKICRALTSLISVDPSLALKPAHNQSKGKKLAGGWEDGRGQGVSTGSKENEGNRGGQETSLILKYQHTEQSVMTTCCMKKC